MTGIILIIGVIIIVLYGFYLMKGLDRFLQSDGIRSGERPESAVPKPCRRSRQIRTARLVHYLRWNKKTQPLV